MLPAPALSRGASLSHRSSAFDRAVRWIEEVDDAVGAFVEVVPERVGSDEEAAATGVRSTPLRDVTLGVKELFDVAGLKVEGGSDVLAGRRPRHDAAVVAALRSAGAVIVGTTRSHEFGWGITTQHVSRGSTRNPWDLTKIPGGSSGGSAAAVAAGMVDLAVGTDTGGSIRLPAAFCGVLGLKTTPGRISHAGLIALAPTFDSVGFFARSVGLLTTALACSQTRTAQVSSPTNGTFAVPRSLSPHHVDDERLAALHRVNDTLDAIGLRQVDIEPPDALELYEAFVPVQAAEAWHVHTSVMRTFPARASAYGADVRERLEAASAMPRGRWLAAQRARTRLRAQFLEAFGVADLLLSLASPTAPSPVTDADWISLDGDRRRLRDVVMPYTVPQNVVGLPSMTFPVGVDACGLPIGVQLTGRPWSEPMLLSIVATLQHAGVVTVRTPRLFEGDDGWVPQG